jgi:hypothetical protein
MANTASGQQFRPNAIHEQEAVRELGTRIGFGRMMQLAVQIWRAALAADGGAGGEFTIGPCAAMTVPCPCPDGAHCEWCCGSKRVTERVLGAIKGR